MILQSFNILLCKECEYFVIYKVIDTCNPPLLQFVRVLLLHHPFTNSTLTSSITENYNKLVFEFTIVKVTTEYRSFLNLINRPLVVV